MKWNKSGDIANRELLEYCGKVLLSNLGVDSFDDAFEDELLSNNDLYIIIVAFYSKKGQLSISSIEVNDGHMGSLTLNHNSCEEKKRTRGAWSYTQ